MRSRTDRRGARHPGSLLGAGSAARDEISVGRRVGAVSGNNEQGERFDEALRWLFDKFGGVSRRFTLISQTPPELFVQRIAKSVVIVFK